jgi:hypothetical protein
MLIIKLFNHNKLKKLNNQLLINPLNKLLNHNKPNLNHQFKKPNPQSIKLNQHQLKK